MFDARIVGAGVKADAKPKIRVLFYTDLFGFVTDNPVFPGFQLGILRHLIERNQPFFADITVELVNRHSDGHASHKITPELLANYEQVWFFGWWWTNKPGEPENELTDPEVAALRSWMDAGGGVLITGDHSNPRQPDEDPSLPGYMNLGRAIGHRIPRAGELRVWNDRPDSSIEHSHNTHTPDPWGSDINNPISNDLDPYPQELILRRWGGRPHPLFSGRRGPITVFPDHMHEGQLVIPTSYPEDVWPVGPKGQPKPEIIARGTDKRNGEVYGVTTAYDGAAAGVGRIVADSTWHHYFDINLWGFEEDGEVLRKLTEYYINLVLWLTPQKVRQEGNSILLQWLATHPTVLAVLPEGTRTPGNAAAGLVRETAGDVVLQDLVWPLPGSPTVPEDLLLGAQVKAVAAAGVRAGGDPVADGLQNAAVEYANELRSALTSAEGLGDYIATALR